MNFIDDMSDPRLKFFRGETYKETVSRVSLIRAIAQRDRAVRALKANGFMDLGGEEWKPPVNEYATLYHQNRREFEILVEDVLIAVNKAVKACPSISIDSIDEELDYEETMGHEIR